MIRFVSLVLLLLSCTFASAAEPRKPNVILMYCDDLGYGDLACYDSKTNVTPNLDRLAHEGVRFTQFYTAAAVCSASRAALLTGCYPQRIGIMGALGPHDKHGIHADEKLLPEYFREQGYATAIFGKWHLGHREPFLPTKHGFDRYFGLPYSNDMWPFHPTAKFPALPLMEGETTLHENPDQTKLTTWYTQRSVKFIEENKDRPFFLYVPHSMPHVPLFVGYDHYNKTGKGLYADVISEIDSSLGTILATLERLKLTDDTIVLFSSDNGPWLPYGNHAGSKNDFREGKGTTFEGGMRVPLIAKWPNRFAKGVTCNELAGTIDVLPTLVNAIGGEIDPASKIDGLDLTPLLRNEPGAKTPHDFYYYYWIYGLDAVRSGPWKLHFPHNFPSLTGKPGENGMPAGNTQGKIEKSLYNLNDDPSESRNVLNDHPEIVAKLEQIAAAARADLGDSHTKQLGENRRPAGKIE